MIMLFTIKASEVTIYTIPIEAPTEEAAIEYIWEEVPDLIEYVTEHEGFQVDKINEGCADHVLGEKLNANRT
tara:strand:+ start:402 stop:617 length:216 start_codon:yes stop_codon:yes gene_type:complete